MGDPDMPLSRDCMMSPWDIESNKRSGGMTDNFSKVLARLFDEATARYPPVISVDDLVMGKNPDAFDEIYARFVEETGKTIRPFHLRKALLSSRKNRGMGRLDSNEQDVFYMAASPRDPTQIKMGSTSNLDKITGTYRRINPDTEIIGSWPCSRHKEDTARKTIAHLAHGSQLITDGGHGREVYRFASQAEALDAANRYFSKLTH